MLIEIYQCDYPGCENKSDQPFEDWSASYKFDGMLCNFRMVIQAHLTVYPEDSIMLCPQCQERLLRDYFAQQKESELGESEIFGECDGKAVYGNPMDNVSE